MADYTQLLTLGNRMTKFESLVEKTAHDLPAGHPQKDMLTRLAAMLKTQRGAMAQALTRFNEAAKESLAKSKSDLEKLQQEFAASKDKMKGILDGAKAAKEAPPEKGKTDGALAAPPAVEIDPNFGMDIGKELLDRYRPAQKDGSKTISDREIWQDWT